jgi:hypothetical protein
MTDETQNAVAETFDIDGSDSLDWDSPSESEFADFTVGETEEEAETEAEDEIEEGEEDVAEDDSEVEEDVEDSDVEEEEEATEEEDESPLKEVNDNLKKAVTAERTKRKEATDRASQLEQEIALLKGSSSGDDYTALVAQIKELGLEDVLDVKEKQSLDPRVQKMLDAQEQQRQQSEQTANRDTFNTNMQADVKAKVGSFKNIDAKDNSQGEALANMIIAGVVQGGELEDVVDSSLKMLDALLGANLKKRQPAVTPKRKVKAATKTTASAKQRQTKTKQNAGNFDDVFMRAVSGFDGLD